MGFFGDLLGGIVNKEATDFISNAVSKSFDNIINGGTENLNNSNSTNSTRNNTSGGGEDGFRERFESIIEQEWPEYELVRNVSALDFNAEDGARDYSYGIYYNGQPKLMIMIIRGNNEYRRSEILKSKRACEQNGISYLNFMVYFPNEYDYILERLRKNM